METCLPSFAFKDSGNLFSDDSRRNLEKTTTVCSKSHEGTQSLTLKKKKNPAFSFTIVLFRPSDPWMST